MKATQNTLLKIKQPSAFDFFKRFPTEESATKYFETARWPSGVRCHRCGHGDVYRIKDGKLFSCKSCKKQFTVRTGTVMEDSRISVQKWLYAMYLVTTARKGISSIQLAKEVGITQKSAWFMLGRLRESCEANGQVSGVVEADESYFGGKEKNKHENKKQKAGRGAVGKTIVFGAKERDGHVRATVIQGTDRATIEAVIGKHVTKGSTVYTDEHASYKGLNGYTHDSISHSAGEYVRGDVHTNSIEAVWAVMKRGHYGIYHLWSEKHLHRYINEFTFRLNTRDLPIFDRAEGVCGINIVRMMAAGMEGKRLTYKRLIAV